MSIKKQFLKGKPECKITFRLDKPAIEVPVESVKIVGSFNNWSVDGEEMDGLKSGDFTKALTFATEQQIQFRYLINNSIWWTDFEADGLIENGMGDEQFNALVQI